jgi:phenylpyruvate tautomerase PptA (4-oxalocrotonate tautomerase family)
MPAITIQSLELAEEQKEFLAEKYITLFSEVTKVPKDRIYLFFDGYPLDCAAKDGKLFSHNPPKGIVGKFNQAEHIEFLKNLRNSLSTDE